MAVTSPIGRLEEQTTSHCAVYTNEVNLVNYNYRQKETPLLGRQAEDILITYLKQWRFIVYMWVSQLQVLNEVYT